MVRRPSTAALRSVQRDRVAQKSVCWRVLADFVNFILGRLGGHLDIPEKIAQPVQVATGLVMAVNGESQKKTQYRRYDFRLCAHLPLPSDGPS
jgi:hypothetical protein